MRRCIVTGELKEKSQLLRFVFAPDHQIVPDLYKKLSGKGIYVSISYKALLQAIRKNLFSKALKKNARVSANLLQIVENILHKNALNAISLAKKAGIIVIGLDKVSEVLKKEQVALVLAATDAGEDGLKKLDHLTAEIPVYRLFMVEELDKALDKGNTVYLAFLKSPMADMVKDNFDKLSAFIKDKNNGDEIL